MLKKQKKKKYDRYDTGKFNTTKLEKLQKKDKNQVQVMTIIYIFILLFFALMSYIIYFQMKNANRLTKDARNPKLLAREEQITMGSIYASDTTTELAKTVIIGDKKVRQYPFGEIFAHIVGYSINGKSGLEAKYYKQMLSIPEDNEDLFEKIKSLGDEKIRKGNSVVTTLSKNMQKIAYDAMGKRKGSVVLIEPSTGKIIAMVSKPSFNPNNIKENWDNLVKDETNSPLLNRATQGLYPPGSTFKVLTALEYMRENKDYEDYVYNCNGSITRYGLTIGCFGNVAHGNINLRQALEQSCNGAFIDIGLSLDINKYRNFVENFGFNKNIPFEDVDYSKSIFKLKSNSSYGEIMQTVFGQGNTLVTPFQNVLIAATIANKGVQMHPTLVDKVIDENKNIVSQFEPSVYKQVLDKKESDVITDYMSGVWTQINNNVYDVAAKTGTAQYNNNKNNHNLLIGFAPVKNPKIAFSIILEGYDGQPDYDTDTKDIAKIILDKYFMG